MQARWRSLIPRVLGACAYVLLGLPAAGCAGSVVHQPTIGVASASAPQRYEGTCAFLGIEEVPGPGDQNSDSVSLVATYRLAEANVRSQEGPLSLKFRVERSRVGNLRSHLEQHPNVLCRPSTQTREAGAAYTVDVPPFEGQSGEVAR